MISAFENPNQPPMMAPESQSPPPWRVAQANHGMQGNPKQQVMMAMMARQLAQAGHNLAGGAPTPMPRGKARVHDFDPYGNMQG